MNALGENSLAVGRKCTGTPQPLHPIHTVFVKRVLPKATAPTQFLEAFKTNFRLKSLLVKTSGDHQDSASAGISTASDDLEASQGVTSHSHSGDTGTGAPPIKWSERARAALLNDEPLPGCYSIQASPTSQAPKQEDTIKSGFKSPFKPSFEESGTVTKLVTIDEASSVKPHRTLDLYHTHFRTQSASTSRSRRPSHRRTHSYAVEDKIYEAPKDRFITIDKPYDAMRASEVRKLLEQDVAGLAIYEQEVENWSAEDLPNLGCQLKFQFVASGLELNDADLKACVALVEHTSGKDYRSSSLGWKPKKKEAEMREKDMMFFLIRAHDLGGRVLGFMSFMFTNDDPPKQDREVVYLYEIHLTEMIRGRGVGGKLLAFLEASARHCGVSKTMLTVFVANEAARGVYERAGYEKDSCSPEDRVVRSRVKKADYIIMSKEL